MLVATPVIEVGVNVPNATLMLIEGAENFGLAQLHQLRGRINRGSYQGYCFAFPGNSKKNDTAPISLDDANTSFERLKFFAESENGFELAEADLKLRGPGDMYGIEQSGLPPLKFASLFDTKLLEEAQAAVRKIFAHDPRLTKEPLLKKRLAEMDARVHWE